MGARNDRAPHEVLDNLFLKQRKCPGIDAGAEFTEDQPSGGLGAGPDPPSLMFLRYEVANKRRSFGRRSDPLTFLQNST